MNNLLSYCGLTDARMRASEKDLPVLTKSAQHSQTVEHSHSFFTVSTACYKSLTVIKPKGVIKTVWEIAQKTSSL